MNIRRIAAWGLGLMVIAIGSTWLVMPNQIARAEQLNNGVNFTVEQQAIIGKLQTAHAVYLGETHDRARDRQQQLAIIQALFTRRSALAIGLEMFQRNTQPILDRYLAGQITENELRQETEFDRRWGYSWTDLAPILRYAQAHQLPLIALNTPIEITRKAAKFGLESLKGEDLVHIPPIDQIDRQNIKYREMIRASYQQHLGKAPISSKSFDRFYTAQLLWDETMAERIANFVKQQPDRQIVILAGRSHIIYGYGIPDRVRRRLGQSQFTQKTVLLSNQDDQQPPQPADFIWDRQ